MFRKTKNEKPKRRNYLRPDQIEVHDFAKASRYFSTDIDDKDLYEDMDTLENNKRYIGWIQSFSKKIVSVTFGLYLVSVAFSIGMVWYSFQTGTITGIDTFITEKDFEIIWNVSGMSVPPYIPVWGTVMGINEKEYLWLCQMELLRNLIC